MAEDLVTILRYRYVIEEMVMKRSEFDKINKAPTDQSFEDTSLFILGRCSNAEFVDWQWGSEEEFLPSKNCDMREPHGYLVFDGDVTNYSDDCAYANGEEWEHEFPFEIRGVSEGIKLLNAIG